MHKRNCRFLPHFDVNEDFENCPMSKRELLNLRTVQCQKFRKFSYIAFSSSEFPHANKNRFIAKNFKNASKETTFVRQWGTSELEKVILENFINNIID